MPRMIRPGTAVAVIVLSQWLGTSLWFSPSGAADGLMLRLQLGPAAFGVLLAATQLGFIAGTLAFAASGAADRHPASRIFAWSCVAGALVNAAVALPAVGFAEACVLRFAVGLCLAGIYPLGMKMIVQWVGGKPAAALGWLIGMLTLGTAMPHGLRAAGAEWPWQAVLLASSALAVLGGAAVAWLGEGGHVRAGGKPTPVPGTPGRVTDPPAAAAPRAGLWGVARRVFAVQGFRASAFGYFGHMWELYAFWGVLPWLCAPISAALAQRQGAAAPSVALLSFAVIGVGALGCILGGQWARRIGSARVAALALAGSGAMCLAYPLLPATAPLWQLAALGFWGVCVVADSPQFSAISAQQCPPEVLASGLLVQNGIGFFITVVSILVMSHALPAWGAPALWLLAPGPVLGLIGMRALLRPPAPSGS
ncbi:MFS transporter [Aquincola sp. MAHUQ-54]|uniref:MFS transporter n=1 Tax=Aquincola agrisoli TaxID=3119538 RepID=A0AAW9Q115_9BURK